MKIVSSMPIVELDYGFSNFEEVIFNKMKVKVVSRNRFFDENFVQAIGKIEWMFIYDLEEIK